MSSILLCATPVHGHVAPTLPLISTLVAAGHRVRALTGQRYRAAVEGAGAEFLPLPASADYDDTRIDESFPGRVGLTGPKVIRYDMQAIFLAPMAAQASAVDAALAAEPTDVVLVESMFTGIMPLLARPRSERPAVLNLGIVPLAVSSRDTAPFGLGIPPLAGPLGRLRNGLIQGFTEKVIFGPVQKYGNERMREICGRELPAFFMNWMSIADGIVQFTVEGFEYPRSDLPVPVHFVGPVSRSAGAAASSVPLPDWWGDLDDSRPVVHVTQGTIANNDLEELILPTVRGLADRNVLVVVSTGGRDAAALRAKLPANARAAEFLPYEELLAKTDVMVTNGGYGGVHFALRHGVPLVVAGMTEDKAEVSARVAWSGAGVNLRTNKPTDAAVAAAVDRVLADPSYRAASSRLGSEIAVSPGAAGILPLVEEYATQLHPVVE